MTDQHARPGEGNNADLEAIHRSLIALVAQLEASIDGAPTAEAIKTITDQIVEVNARVAATGRVLLAHQSDEIARHAQTISLALPDIEDEIRSLQHCERLVRSITSVLRTVDEAVRVASLVC